jgi:hypothetical protein
MLFVLKATELQVNSKVRSNTAIKHSSASSELTILKSTVDKLEGNIAEVIANITVMWLQTASSTMLRVEPLCVQPVRSLTFGNPTLFHVGITVCVCACVHVSVYLCVWQHLSVIYTKNHCY